MAKKKARKPSREEIDLVDEMIKETQGLDAPEPQKLMDCPDGEVATIRTYPDPILRERAQEVVEFGDDLRKLVADLATTMYASGGVGLAAPQIGVPLRVFIVDMLNGRPQRPGQPSSQLLVAVNPKIWPVDAAVKRDAERCLSFPTAVETIPRATKVALKAYLHTGEPFAMNAGADLGRALQHEYDHLDGKLIIDYLGKKRARLMQATVRRAL